MCVYDIPVLLMFCCLVVLLSCCPHAPLPCLHPRPAVVVLEATHPIPPQYIDKDVTAEENDNIYGIDFNGYKGTETDAGSDLNPDSNASSTTCVRTQSTKLVIRFQDIIDLMYYVLGVA
jgi:hypothetical protein